MAKSGRVGAIRGRFGVLGELFAFLWARKLFWLIPLVATLLIFAVLIILGSVAGVGPFVYTFF